MTREDKRYVVLLLITIILTIWGAILIQRAYPQPQPALKVDEQWGKFEFKNGSTWYIRKSAIVCVHSVPESDVKTLGHRTVLYFQGGKVHTPLSTEEINQLFHVEKEKTR